MIRRLFDRLARMDRAEIRWRAAAAARAAAERTACAWRAPVWTRAALARRLAPSLGDVRAHLVAGNWPAAHVALTRRLIDRAPGFVIRAGDAAAVRRRIRDAFPAAADEATVRAERIVAGRHDLLGYSNLEFDGWHHDPINQRTAPRMFWASVPYLDASCGDHKIIWELNRHQHWLALGRAYWLSGDARYRERWLVELASWLDANPPLTGINWSSMLELGLRSISWVWALHFFAEPDANDSAPWTIDLLLGLDRQLEHVAHNLSYYFSPNTHLLGEALGLYVASRAVPELAASERRAQLGRTILIAEAVRQIAADGGHCERSTHYHRYALDFYLLALAVARITHDPIAAVFERAVVKLAAAARLLCDDTGHVPHIGDDDGGMLFPIAGRQVDDWRDSLGIAAALTGDDGVRIGPQTEEELWMLGRRKRAYRAAAARGSAALEASGYYISRHFGGTHIVIDGGPHGYQNGGHAHADALSLTLSRNGQPLLVDTGTACYTTDPALRDRFRSTAAHNTLVLDGRPQSVAAGPFHWAHTADGRTHRWRTTGGFDYFDGSHNGYAPAEHRRRVLITADMMVVADYIGGDQPHQASVHWHVDPRWYLDVRHRSVSLTHGEQRVTLHTPGGQIALHQGDHASGLGWHSPVYGVVEPATTLELAHAGAAPFWLVSVFDWSADDPVRDLHWLPVWSEAGVIGHAIALSIVRDRATDRVMFAEPHEPAARGTWRVAEFETDARMLCARAIRGGALQQLGIVDGSLVRSGGRRACTLTLPRTAPALFIDEPSIRTFSPCAASPAS